MHEQIARANCNQGKQLTKNTTGLNVSQHSCHVYTTSSMTTTKDAGHPLDFDRHSKFYHWMKQQGVRINGVIPVKIPGRGMGIVAQQRIEVGEESVSCPKLLHPNNDLSNRSAKHL